MLLTLRCHLKKCKVYGPSLLMLANILLKMHIMLLTIKLLLCQARNDYLLDYTVFFEMLLVGLVAFSYVIL